MVQFDPTKHALQFVEYENGVSTHAFYIVDAATGRRLERAQGVSSLLRSSIVKPNSNSTGDTYLMELASFTGTQAHALAYSQIFGTRAPDPSQMQFFDPNPASDKKPVNVYNDAKRAADQWVTAVRNLERSGYSVVGGELPILGRQSGGYYAGIADLILQDRNGQMYVYDFKSNKVNPTTQSGGRYERFQESYPLQLGLYSNAEYIATGVQPYRSGTSHGQLATGMTRASLQPGGVIWYPGAQVKGMPDSAIVAALRNTPDLQRVVSQILAGQKVQQRDVVPVSFGAYHDRPMQSQQSFGQVRQFKNKAEQQEWMRDRAKLPTVNGKVPRLTNISKARSSKNFKATFSRGDGSFVSFDLETTGLSQPTFNRQTGKWEGSEIWEIGATKYDRNGHKIGEFHRIFRPENGIPENITQKFGIDDSMLSGLKPLSKKDLWDLNEFIGTSTTIGYNTQKFDIPFLRNEAERLGLTGPGEGGQILGPFGPEFEDRNVDLLAFLRGQRFGASSGGPFASLSQDTIREYLGLDPSFAHNALGDTYSTAAILDAYAAGKFHPDNLDYDKLEQLWRQLKPGVPFRDFRDEGWTPGGQLRTSGTGKYAKKGRRGPGSSVDSQAAHNVDSSRPRAMSKNKWLNDYYGAWKDMVQGIADGYRKAVGYYQMEPDTGEQKEIDNFINEFLKGHKAAEIKAALENGIFDQGEEAVRRFVTRNFNDFMDKVAAELGDMHSAGVDMPVVDFINGARNSAGGPRPLPWQTDEFKRAASQRGNRTPPGGRSGSGSGSGSGGSGGGGGGGDTGASPGDEDPEEMLRKLQAAWSKVEQRVAKMREVYDSLTNGSWSESSIVRPGHDAPLEQLFHGYVQARATGGTLGSIASNDIGSAMKRLMNNENATPLNVLESLERDLGKGFNPARLKTVMQKLLGTWSGSSFSAGDRTNGALSAVGFEESLLSSSPSSSFMDHIKEIEDKQSQAAARRAAGGGGYSGGNGRSGGSGGGGGNPPLGGFSGFGDDEDDVRRNAERNQMLVRAMSAYGQTDSYKVGSFQLVDNDTYDKFSPLKKIQYERLRALSQQQAAAHALGFSIPDYSNNTEEFWNPKSHSDVKIGGEVRKALDEAGFKASKLAQHYIVSELEATIDEAEKEAQRGPARRGTSGMAMDQRVRAWDSRYHTGFGDTGRPGDLSGNRMGGGLLGPIEGNVAEKQAIMAMAQFSELQLQMKRGAAYKSYVEAGLHPDVAYTLSQGDYNAAKNDMAAKAARDAKRQRSGTTGTIQHLFESSTGSSSPLDFLGSRALRTGVWATSGMLYYSLADGMKKDWDSVKEMQRDQVALEQALGYSQPNAPRGYANKVSNQVMGMSSQFGFNPEHIMDVALALQGSMSPSGSTADERLNNTMDATKAVVLLSKVGHVELQQSMENLVAISNAYRQPDIASLTKSGNVGAAAALTPGKEMMNAVNGLTALSNKYSVNMEQTSTAMARMGDIFQTMGVDSGTAAGWLGAIQQNTGESGLQITSKLERVFPQFLDPTTQGKMAEILGPAGVLNFQDLQGTPDAKKVMDAVGEAYARYKSGDKSGPQLNEGQVMQFAMATGGPRGYGEVMKLIENYGLAQQMSKTYNSGAGTKAAEERWDALSKTALERTKELSGAWLQLVKNVASSGLLQTFGALAAVMTKLAQVANSVFGLFDRFTNALGFLGPVIRGLVGVGVGTAAYRMVFNSNRTLSNMPVLSSFVGNTRSMRGEYYGDMTIRQALRSARNPNMSVLSGEKAERDRLEWTIRQAGSLNFDTSGIADVKPIMFGLKAGISDVLPSFPMLGRALRKLTGDVESSGSGTPGRFAQFRARLGSDQVDANGNVVKVNKYRRRFLDSQLMANGFTASELNDESRAYMASELEKSGVGAAQIGSSRLAMMAGRAAVPGAIIGSGAMAVINGLNQAGVNSKTLSQFEQTYGRQFYGNDNGAKIAAIDQALQSGSNLSGSAVSITDSIPIVGGFFASPAYETGITLSSQQLSQARSMRKGLGEKLTGGLSDAYAWVGEHSINPFFRRDSSSTPNQLRNYEAYLNAQKDKVNEAVIAEASKRHETILSPQDAQYEVQAYMKSALYGSQAYDLYATGTLPGGTQQILSGQYKTATGADVEKTLQSQIGSIDSQLAEYAKMNASGTNYVDQDTIKALAAQRQDFQQQLIEYNLARRAASELLNAVKGNQIDQAMAQFTNAMDKWKSFGSKDTAEAMQAAADAMNAAFSVAQASQNQRTNAIQGLGATAVTPYAQNQVAGQLMNANIDYYELLQKNAPGSAQTFQAGLGMVQSWRSYQDTVHQNNMSLIDAQANLASSQTMDPLAQAQARRQAAEAKIQEITRYQNNTETFNTGNETLDKFLQELKDKATDPMQAASDAFKQASDLSNSAASVQSTAANLQVQAANTQAAAASAMGTAVSALNLKLGGSPYAGASAMDSTFPLPAGFGGADTSMAANKPGGSIYSSQVPKYKSNGTIGDNLKGDANSAKRAAMAARGGHASVNQGAAAPSVSTSGGKPAGMSDHDWALVLSAAQKYGVDPMVLVAIGMHETGWGTQGDGRNGMYLGYGSFNNGSNYKYAGLSNQLNGAASLLSKWGAGSIGAVASGKASRYASDPKWSAAVVSMYNSLTGGKVMVPAGGGAGGNGGNPWGSPDGSNADLINAQAEAAQAALQAAVIQAQQREAGWIRDAGAASKEKQVSAQINATKDMISTLQNNHGDPVEIANEQKQLAELYYEQAQRDIERYAQAWRLNHDDTNKYSTLQEQSVELQKQMDAYVSAGGQTTDAEYQKMAADKKAAIRDAALQNTEYGVNDLTYSFNMHETSWTNYINGLKKFRDSVDKSSRSGLELWQQINEQILNAVESVSLNANIPTDIKVPTLYEVRRFIGAGLNGQAYMGSSTPINVPTGGPVPGVSSQQAMAQAGQTVNISVNGADTAFVLQVMSQYLGPANMSRSTYTTTRRV